MTQVVLVFPGSSPHARCTAIHSITTGVAPLATGVFTNSTFSEWFIHEFSLLNPIASCEADSTC